MTDQRVVNINLGTIPSRTGVDAHINIDARTGAQVTILHYHCLDCKFRTNLVEEAIEHQKNAPAWHRVKGMIKGSPLLPYIANAISAAMALFLIVEPIIFNLAILTAVFAAASGGALLVFNFWIFMRMRDLKAKIRASRIEAVELTK